MWVFGNVPMVSSVLPSLVAKLKTAKSKFLSSSVAASASSVVKVQISFNFGEVLNTSNLKHQAYLFQNF